MHILFFGSYCDGGLVGVLIFPSATRPYYCIIVCNCNNEINNKIEKLPHLPFPPYHPV